MEWAHETRLVWVETFVFCVYYQFVLCVIKLKFVPLICTERCRHQNKFLLTRTRQCIVWFRVRLFLYLLSLPQYVERGPSLSKIGHRM